jgi:gamma-glutamyltranspeptidase/glutathione hydrolase
VPLPQGLRDPVTGGPVTTRPELAGSFGMVAGTHWLAAGVAMSVLERGGNAADAAVAAGLVLQVVEPHLNGPGGEVPILVHAAGQDRPRVICGQGTAPASATPQAFADLGLDAVPGTGLLAATVPGAFGAWMLLLRDWGTWHLRDVLAPALAYARDGVPVVPGIEHALRTVRDHFVAHWPTSAATYLDGDRVPQVWSRLRLPSVAATYQRVLAEAEAAGAGRERQIEAATKAWYGGFVAEAVDRFCRRTRWRDTSGREHAGLLRGQDMAGWRAGVEDPVSVVSGVAEVCKAGPWSQGPVLLQQLRLLDGQLPADLDPHEPGWVHRLVECQKLAYADREAWYGDPLAGDVPLEDLLDPAYAAARRVLVDDTRADLDLRPGSPGGRTPRLPTLAEYGPDGRARQGRGGSGRERPVRPGVGEPTLAADGAVGGDTCHLDVVDRWGTMVSATPSGGWLQSSPVVPDLGFPLGTRAQMFRLEPGLPATLRPGTRPRTTLTPTLLLREGRPWVALGTPGGDQQDQWSLLLVLRLLHAAGRDQPLALQAAIDAPMLHTGHAPSSFHPRAAAPGRLVMEDRWPVAVRDELARRGHDVAVVGGWTLGRLSAVARDRAGAGWLRAASDRRGGQGYALGR